MKRGADAPVRAKHDTKPSGSRPTSTRMIRSNSHMGEVWIWQNNQLQVYCLQDDSYQQQSASKLLPDLDLALLAQHIVIKDPLDAVVQWRKAIVSRKSGKFL